MSKDKDAENEVIYLRNGREILKFRPRDLGQTAVAEIASERRFARIVYLKGEQLRVSAQLFPAQNQFTLSEDMQRLRMAPPKFTASTFDGMPGVLPHQ